MGWVRIIDQKPAMNKLVLLTKCDGQVYVGKRFMKKSRCTETELYRLGLADCLEDKVVAWMPLPEPYKGE